MATLRSVWNDIREKHFHIAESKGSLGIIGMALLLVVAVLLFVKPFLGRFSMIIAFALCVLIPLFNL